MGVAAGMVVGVEAAAFTVVAVGLVDFTAEVVGLVVFTAGVAAGMAEAVGFTDLLPMAAGPTWVMDGVAMALTFRLTAFMDMDLVATP